MKFTVSIEDTDPVPVLGSLEKLRDILDNILNAAPQSDELKGIWSNIDIGDDHYSFSFGRTENTLIGLIDLVI
jgi:hypothetical protein